MSFLLPTRTPRFTRPIRGFADDFPDGVVFGVVPLAPAANEVFTPAELEERIAWHAARVDREQPPARERALCWACGESSPSGNRGLRKAGWHLRGNPKLIEMYCQSCWLKWGWPDAAERRASA